MDISTKVVSDHNETIDWCERISRHNEYSVYRPYELLLQSRNVHLHQLMHHRSHQQEY